MDNCGINEKRICDWEVALFYRRKIRNLFERYQPNAVLFTKLFSTNIHVVKEARKRGVRSICLVEAWDNLTSKGPFSIIPDHILAWNEDMKGEAIQYHNFPSEKIDVVGIPQFDFYCDTVKCSDRESFFRRHGFDERLKLITYCVTTGHIAPTDPEIVGLVYEAIMDRRIKYPAQLLVRLHPNTRGENLLQFEKFKRLPRVFVQQAGRVAKIQDGWDPSMDDLFRLSETMRYSDVIINVFSTIVLDAIAFDTPVVGIAFDGKTRRDYYHSNLRYYDWTHVKPVVRSGAIRVAYDLDELVDAVNLYLQNPSVDAQARMKVRREQMLGLDGNSSRRAGRAILRLMGLSAVGEVEEEAIVPVNVSDPSSPYQD
jgi:hypothetical protein